MNTLVLFFLSFRLTIMSFVARKIQSLAFFTEGEPIEGAADRQTT